MHKNGFCFCFFSLGLGIGSRVRIKMWMMWNNTRPPLYQCWTHNFPPLTLTNKHKRSDLPYRFDALLEAYSKRNPIVVLHNVYMDQNQSCLSAWYVNKHTFLEDFLYMFCFKFEIMVKSSFVLSFKSWLNLLKIVMLAWTAKSSPLVLRKHPFKIRIMGGNSNSWLISFTKFKLNSHNDGLR